MTIVLMHANARTSAVCDPLVETLLLPDVDDPGTDHAVQIDVRHQHAAARHGHQRLGDPLLASPCCCRRCR